MQILRYILVLMALSSSVYAEENRDIVYDDFQLHTVRTATHDGSFVSVDYSNTVGFDVLISGTSATVVFRISGAGKFGWQELACFPSDSETSVPSTTTSGFYTCNIAGGDAVSARIDECTSCTVSVVARRTTAVIGGGGGGGGGAGTLDQAFDGGKEIDGANSFANAFKVSGGGVRKWYIYDDATDGLQMKCVVSGVADACNIIRLLGSGFRLEYTNSSAVAIFTLTESTGALTNVTLNGESTGNTITLTEETWFDVVACQDTTAQHIWNTIAATSPAATCDTGSNTQKGYASFDATTDEAIQMDWVLPTGFTGAIDIHFIWKAPATSGATGWCAQLIRVADASTSDPAFPAQASGNCVSDTAKGTTLQENHATISGVTCTSCAARDHVYVRISRDANGGAVTDDMTGDAHLMKVGRTWRVAH